MVWARIEMWEKQMAEKERKEERKDHRSQEEEGQKLTDWKAGETQKIETPEEIQAPVRLKRKREDPEEMESPLTSSEDRQRRYHQRGS